MCQRFVTCNKNIYNDFYMALLPAPTAQLAGQCFCDLQFSNTSIFLTIFINKCSVYWAWPIQHCDNFNVQWLYWVPLTDKQTNKKAQQIECYIYIRCFLKLIFNKQGSWATPYPNSYLTTIHQIISVNVLKKIVGFSREESLFCPSVPS